MVKKKLMSLTLFRVPQIGNVETWREVKGATYKNSIIHPKQAGKTHPYEKKSEVSQISERGKYEQEKANSETLKYLTQKVFL